MSALLRLRLIFYYAEPKWITHLYDPFNLWDRWNGWMLHVRKYGYMFAINHRNKIIIINSTGNSNFIIKWILMGDYGGIKMSEKMFADISQLYGFPFCFVMIEDIFSVFLQKILTFDSMKCSYAFLNVSSNDAGRYSTQ